MKNPKDNRAKRSRVNLETPEKRSDVAGSKHPLSPRERDGVRATSARLRDRARELRRKQSDAEHALWRRLRGRQLQGLKFRRQYPVPPFIVDFVCLEAGLVIEIDGGQHAENRSYDSARTRRLEAQRFRVLRFWNNEVLKNMDGVLETIMQWLACPHPSPLPEGEGDGDGH